MPEPDQGDGGRKRHQWWAPAERRIGAAARCAATAVRVLRDLIDIAAFIDRHR
jgi:hypothetical protein